MCLAMMITTGMIQMSSSSESTDSFSRRQKVDEHTCCCWVKIDTCSYRIIIDKAPGALGSVHAMQKHGCHVAKSS